MKRVLVIDMLNMYYRAYIVDPSLSSNGQPIGGIKGTLKILQKLIRESRPDEVVICWDGGSRKRRLVQKGYKHGRKPIRLNRNIRTLSQNEEKENKMWQQTRLIEYMNNMPIIQLMKEDIEADDIIAFICKSGLYEGWQKIIVSSDKDFYQLLDDETVLFRPVQKEILNKKDIVERHEIHPNNFALARAIVGDRSDNLKGVPSVGLPTVSKRFPFLAEEKTYYLDDIIASCTETEERLKAHDRILESEGLIRENYKLMQLYTSTISAQKKREIKETIRNFLPEFNKTETIKMMLKDGFGEFNWNSLIQNFNKIVVEKNKK